MIKRIIIILICLLGLQANQIRAQATTTLSIDSFVQFDPIIMGGITNFGVQVRVNNFIGADSLFGDIFYYYLTDSMINAGDSARVLLLDAVNESVVDPFWDTIPVDIQPHEIRTSGPMNLIVIWPAMINPLVGDTDSISFYVEFDGYLNLPISPDQTNKAIVFPSPALQFLYIRPDEMELIGEIILMNAMGQLVAVIPEQQIKSGWISVDVLTQGQYLALIKYKTGELARMKFMKQ